MKTSKNKMSLKEIMAKPKAERTDEEYYLMRVAEDSKFSINGGSNGDESSPRSEPSELSKTFVVTRHDITFRGAECELINFKDITAYAKLNKEKAINSLLKTLNVSVSHDMVHKIGINIEIAQLLLEKLTSSKDKKLVKMIIVASKTALLLANDLIDHRIIENCALEPRYSHGSPAQAIDEIVQIVRLNNALRKDKFVLNFSDLRDLEMKFDTQRLQQVLMNLITNAAKFSDGNRAGNIFIEGTVHIQRMKSSRQLIGNENKNLNRDQTFLKISVRDEGIGIAKEDITKIFTPFYRAKDKDSQELNKKGNGIGLSICQQICRALHGQIDVSSIKGYGACFSFSMQVFNVTKNSLNHSHNNFVNFEKDFQSMKQSDDSSEKFQTVGSVNTEPVHVT